MGLINGKQGNINILQSLNEGVTHQAFGGNIEEIKAVAVQPGQGLAGLCRLQGRVVEV